MRRTSLLSHSLPATLLLAIAACGDSSGGDPATFSSATDLQRQRAIIAASSADAMMGYLIGSFAGAVPPESQCPKVAVAGDTITATFDCTDDDGQRIDGKVTATNVPPIFGESSSYDPTRDAVITFAGYRQRAATPAEEMAFDGTIRLRPDRSIVAELDAQLYGIAVTTDATFRSAGELVSAAEGSSIDVDGLGRATIHGAWSLDDEAPAGLMALQGAERLEADFAHAVDGCVPLTIDGHAVGALCDAPSAP